MTWSVNLSRISGGQKVKKLSGEGLLPPSRSLPSAANTALRRGEWSGEGPPGR